MRSIDSAHEASGVRGDIDSRDDVERLVRNFYRDAAMDDVLGPVFEAAHVHWDAHVATLIDFWSWQLLGVAGYEGQPLRAHEPVHARTPLTDAHYERWVELFCATVDDSFSGPRAEAAKTRGRKMAAAMERLMSGAPLERPEPVGTALPVSLSSSRRGASPMTSGAAPLTPG